MYIFLKSDEHFAFAGLWESWKAPAGVTILSCTIITTEPNSFMVPIHNRMPVYCLRSQRRCWLDPQTEDSALPRPLLLPLPTESIESYPVSTIVNPPEYHVPECIEPVGL